MNIGKTVTIHTNVPDPVFIPKPLPTPAPDFTKVKVPIKAGK